MSTTGKLNVSANFVHDIAADLGPKTAVYRLSKLLDFIDGAGAGAIQKLFGDSRTITVPTAAAVNDDLDIAGGVSDAYGTVTTFAAVKALVLVAGAANPGSLIVGAGTNPWPGFRGAGANTLTLKAGGIIVLSDPSAAGEVVTGGTGDILRVQAPAVIGSYTFDILIAGI